MKFIQYHILHYGEIFDDKNNFNAFTVIVGNNEQNKTMRLEAWIRMLLGKDALKYEKIKRIEEDPNGFLLGEKTDGTQVNFTCHKENQWVKETGMDPEEARNLFIIRNSDLQISNADKFYQNLNAKLTGVKIQPIMDIKENLLDIGNTLTSGKFTDSQNNNNSKHKIKSRIKNANIEIEKIGRFLNNPENTEYSNLELKIAQNDFQIKNFKEQINTQQNALKREKYEQGTMKILDSENNLKQLKSLILLSKENGHIWSDSRSKISTLKTDLDRNEEDLVLEKQKFQDTQKKHALKEEEFNNLNPKKAIIDEVNQQNQEFRNIRNKWLLFDKYQSTFRLIVLFLLIIFPISLVGSILNLNSLFTTFSGVFGVLTVILVGLFFRAIYENKNQDVKFQLICDNLLKIGIEISNIKEVLPLIQEFEAEYTILTQNLNIFKSDEKNLQLRISSIENGDIPRIENKIDELNKKIEIIQVATQIKSLEEYREKLDEKSELEKDLATYIGILIQLFPQNNSNDLTLEQKLELCKKDLQNLESFKDKAIDTIYSEQELEMYKENVEELGDKNKTFQIQMGSYKNKFVTFKDKAKSILMEQDDQIVCENLDDLEDLNKRYQHFIDKHIQIKDAVLAAHSIFNEIEKEENKKIAEIFNDVYLKETFAHITDKRYKDLQYDASQKILWAIRIDDKRFRADFLSAGTFDQLYFCIRLALGRMRLKGNPGFLILDDPFLRSDITRLYRILDFLVILSEQGWQIIYITAKDEVKEYLKGNSKVNMIYLED